nr:hypothetical protein [Streptomyces sp. ODS25]
MVSTIRRRWEPADLRSETALPSAAGRVHRRALAPCGHVSELIQQRLADIEQRMAELRKTRIALRTLAERAASTDPDACSEARICNIIADPATK